MNESSSKLLAALFAERRVLTVTEVTEQIKDALESEFSPCTCRARSRIISGISRATGISR